MDRITVGSLLFAVVNTIVLTWFIGMLASWAWALGRLWNQRPLLDPEREPFHRPAPWGFVSVVAVCMLYVLLGSTAKRLYEGPARPADPAAPKELFGGMDVLVPLAIVSGLTILLAPILLRVTCGADRTDLGLGRTDRYHQLAVGVIGGLMATPAVLAIQALAVRVWSPHNHPVEEMLKGELSVGSATLALVSTMLLAPMVEEILFRGILQRWLIKVSAGSESGRWPHARENPMVDVGDPVSSEIWELEESSSPEHLHSVEELPLPARSLASPPDRDRPDGTTSPEDSQSIGMGIVLSSIVFASLHMPQWPAPIAIFLLSLALGPSISAPGTS